MRGLHKEETIATILEGGNFIAANDQANMDEVHVEPNNRAALVLFSGVALCFFGSEIVKEFLMIAAAGGILMLIGAMRMKKASRWFRPVALLAVLQILWRTYLTVGSYIPAITPGAVLGWLGGAFALVGLAQLIFLRKGLLDAARMGVWPNDCSRLPILEIGYAMMVILGFFAGAVVVAVKVSAGVVSVWYLYRIYRSAALQ